MKKALKKIPIAPKVAITLIVWGLKLWAKTQRVTIVDPHGVVSPDYKQPTIFVIWHNRLVLLMLLVPTFIRRRLCFLASRSRDGGYIADMLQRVGMIPVRGSTGKTGQSKGGGSALVELKRKLEEGLFVSLTPDGPRGPKYDVQKGVVWLASKTGVPVVPASYNSHNHKELKNWDRTHVPMPFSRGELVIGKPIYIDKDLDDEGMQAARAEIREGMMKITLRDHDSDS